MKKHDPLIRINVLHLNRKLKGSLVFQLRDEFISVNIIEVQERVETVSYWVRQSTYPYNGMTRKRGCYDPGKN